MTKRNKAYKFRLYPTGQQALLIRKTFGCVRFVYNKMLAERIETYETLKDDKIALKKVK
ncbi:helix-turn-helix domain-containing protein, partial [Halalkalibacter kiskunsagensis]